MSAFYLVLYIYAGAMSDSDSVAVTSIPQPSEQACQLAGKQAQKLVEFSQKNLRFVCLKGQQ